MFVNKARGRRRIMLLNNPQRNFLFPLSLDVQFLSHSQTHAGRARQSLLIFLSTRFSVDIEKKQPEHCWQRFEWMQENDKREEIQFHSLNNWKQFCKVILRNPSDSLFSFPPFSCAVERAANEVEQAKSHVNWMFNFRNNPRNEWKCQMLSISLQTVWYSFALRGLKLLENSLTSRTTIGKFSEH